MAQHTVAVGDISLAVTEEGGGAPVILVHGFPELAYSWRHQLPALAEAGLRAIAYDQRGYGGSSKPEEVTDYRLLELVGDLFGLADALEIERFHLVGHDWGSIVAWSAAVIHPERISTLTSLNVPYRGWCCAFPTVQVIDERLRDRFAYVLSFQDVGAAEERFAAGPERWLRRSYQGVAADPEFQTSDEFSVYLDAFVAGGMFGPLSYYRNIDRNIADVSHLAGATVAAPTLMITADLDPVLPASLVDGMERWVPDLTVKAVTDCGHWTQQEQPEQVNGHLIEFLTGVRFAAPGSI
jgi:pimeloyl-ACP methyl ester carboxylesterase